MEKIRVFLVDDEPIILQGLRSTYSWEKWGACIAGAARNPKKAVEEILKLQPDLVITDIRMKQMTGLELIRQVEEKAVKIPLWIVISAYRDFEYAQKACELGAFLYLLKPIEDHKLEEAVLAAGEEIRKREKSKKKLQDYEAFIEDNSKVFEDYMIEKYGGERMEATALESSGHIRSYVNQAAAYVKMHLDDEFLSIATVAGEVHLNPVYFGRLFRQGTGKAFKQYLLEERMKQARHLLRTTDDTIAEICEKVGIPNPSYFTRQFKKHTGCLPTEYRKKI